MSEIFSTSWPAWRAPSINLSASMSLLEPARRLVEITITFFMLSCFELVFSSNWFALNSIANL